jgi:hypothetical protein
LFLSKRIERRAGFDITAAIAGGQGRTTGLTVTIATTAPATATLAFLAAIALTFGVIFGSTRFTGLAGLAIVTLFAVVALLARRVGAYFAVVLAIIIAVVENLHRVVTGSVGGSLVTLILRVLLGLVALAAIIADLLHPLAWHGRRHYAEIVLGVLQVVLVAHTVAARLAVSRVLHVLFIDLGGRAADLHFRAIALKRAIAVVSTTTTAAAAAPAWLTPATALTLHETILLIKIRTPRLDELGSNLCVSRRSAAHRSLF